MRKTIITLVVAVASLVPAAAWADGMPPSAAKTPPAGPGDASKVTMSDLQPDAPNEYTVVKGDTLWGIAGRFLKDPWKWPQIWQMNRDQIKDPHWIYPGNVIRLDRSGENPQLTLGAGGAAGTSESGSGPSGGTESQAVSNVVVLDPRVRVESLQTAVPSIPGSAIGPFLTQPLVVEPGGLDNAPTILATEESRVIVGPGDLAYADRIGSNDGVNWQVFRPGSSPARSRHRRSSGARGQVSRRCARAPLRQSDHARSHQGAPGNQPRRPAHARARGELPELRSARPRQADQGRDHVGGRRRLGAGPVPDHHDQPRCATASRSGTCSRATGAARS